MSVRHADKVGIMCHIFSIFGEMGWNVQEMENIVFQEREACVANITFNGDISKLAEGIEKLKKHEHVYDVTC